MAKNSNLGAVKVAKNDDPFFLETKCCIFNFYHMSYIGISIKDAIEKINKNWFLPAVQRPYVWGNRYESEKYICKLFDSLYQKYPIGGLIMWETNSRVAHREFLTDYKQGDIYKNVDEGLWSREKCLIYDGQQRLQTLFSCLKYSFNTRLLVFDLSYDESNDEDSNTGFKFVDINEQLDDYDIKINYLFCSNAEIKNKASIRSPYIAKANNEDLKFRIETNLDLLWDVFVGRDVKSLAYFSIASDKEEKVNEIFERLNTGGIPLSKADLLFSKIKAVFPDYEANIMEYSKQMFARYRIGLDSYDILQLIHLIVKGRSRIDDNVNLEQIKKCKSVWDRLQVPLNAFFGDYLDKHFRISHMAIIRNKMPLLSLAVYFYEYYNAGKKYRDIDAENLKLVDKFFITAEINDWALQSYTDNFARIMMENKDKLTFPYQELVEFVKERGNRMIDITESMFKGYTWMALKFLTPHRPFEFDYSMPNRYNPELDHIFPVRLDGQDEQYRQDVNVLWNMQPVKGELNNLKSKIHPFAFFTDKEKNASGETITGSKYFNEYDFVPQISDSKWNDHKLFISYRRKKMIEYLKDHYDISLVEDQPTPSANQLASTTHRNREIILLDAP